MMLEQSTRELYSAWLASHASSKKKCQVLRNLQSHLKEVEATLKVADVEGMYITALVVFVMLCGLGRV